MNAGVIPADIEKIKDHQYQRFIDVTPNGESRSWKILGIGVSDSLSTDYNPPDLSLRWLLFLHSAGSRHTVFSSCSILAQQLQLSGSSTRAQQLWPQAELVLGMWNLPGPGIKPVSPALAGRFPYPAPPGNPLNSFLNF